MRRPTRSWEAAAYATAFIVYVALGLLTRNWVLNWVVGPLFPVLALYALPRGAAMIRLRLRAIDR